MAFENLGLLFFAASAPDGGQEIREVVFASALEGADGIAVGIEQGAAGNDALRPLENRPALEIRAERSGLEATRFRDDRLIAEVEHADLRIGRLSGVNVSESPTVADDRAPEARD